MINPLPHKEDAAWRAEAPSADAREPVPFNRPFMVGTELNYVQQAHENRHLSGDGAFTTRCSRWLEQRVGCDTALLTHSCTAALEMIALLADVQPGDEIIMPSFTFVSTANAFALRGGVPVFVDIRPDTLNLDESQIEAAITARTKAIVAVHYAGVACEMDAINAIARRHGLLVIEDAAQGILSTYHGRPLGSLGELSAYSFHETKNITCGEGGALLINEPSFVERAHYIREKGTNRTQFLAGRVQKYTWIDLGSSYLPSEMNAAFLWGQMESAEWITQRRVAMWSTYHQQFEALEHDGRLRRPVVPDGCTTNGHMYFLILPAHVPRETFLARLTQRGVEAVSHYVPLHSSPAGLRYGRSHGPLPYTVDLAKRLVRLPLWLGLETEQDRVVKAIHELLA